MNLLCNAALGFAATALGAFSASAGELTIAIVNNGHMIDMQKVARALQRRQMRSLDRRDHRNFIP